MLSSHERAKLLNEIDIATNSIVTESVAVKEGAFKEFVDRLEFAKAQLTGMEVAIADSSDARFGTQSDSTAYA